MSPSPEPDKIPQTFSKEIFKTAPLNPNKSYPIKLAEILQFL